MSKSQTQQAVEAITEVTGHTGGKLQMTTVQRKAVIEALYLNHQEGEYSIKSDKIGTDKVDICKYISKQISSVMQKEKIFNDGQAYTPKSVGRNNKEIKAMNILIDQLTTSGETETMERVTVMRDEKLAELATKKTSSKVLNVDDLPEELRNLA